MTLTQLRYIVAIVDSGLNITAAGNRIHASQPTISKQLKQLEAELGFQLFTRKGKSLSEVTPAGQEVIEMARNIVAEARSIRSLAANLRGDAKGELTIVTTHTQARFVLPTPVQDFSRKYPAVAVHLRPQEDTGILDQLAAGKADIAIISTSSNEGPTGGIAIPLYRWSRVVAVPRNHPLVGLRRPLKLADLRDLPLVSYDSSLQPGSSLQRVFGAQGLTPRLACTSADADLIKTYVRAGMGVGILAEMAIQEDDDQDLVYLDASNWLPDCTTWLVLRRDRVVRSFALALVGRLAPRINLHQVQHALNDETAEPVWPPAPHWQRRETVKQRVTA